MAGRGKSGLIILTAFILLLIVQPVFGSLETEGQYNDSILSLPEESESSVTVFYSSSCSACNAVLPEIYDLSARYPEISFNIFDVYGSDENRTLMLAFGERYGIDYPAYPIVFTGNRTILRGKSEISNSLEPVLKALRDGNVPDFNYEQSFNSNNKASKPGLISSNTGDGENLSLFLVIIAGIIDGINPCALSVLALLLVTLSNMKSQRNVILGGLVYSFAVFLFYIIAGLGILTVIDYSGYSGIFSITAGIIALAAGIISIAGAFTENNIISPRIPEPGRVAIKDAMEKISIPAAFFLGILVGLFELPCTGGIYIAILGLISSKMTFYDGLPYLLVYNLMFVLPMIAIAFAVGFGLSPDKVDKWRDLNKKRLRIGAGMILIAMALVILAGNPL